jgi:hypothetical protein
MDPEEKQEEEEESAFDPEDWDELPDDFPCGCCG